MSMLLAQFAALQLLDLTTSLFFSAQGLLEGNPVVRTLMQAAGSEAGGLAAAKMVALAVGLYCWRSGRRRLLARANVLYAGVVLWNLVTLAATAFNRTPT